MFCSTHSIGTKYCTVNPSVMLLSRIVSGRSHFSPTFKGYVGGWHNRRVAAGQQKKNCLHPTHPGRSPAHGTAITPDIDPDPGGVISELAWQSLPAPHTEQAAFVNELGCGQRLWEKLLLTGILAMSFILQKANHRPNVLRERPALSSEGAIYGERIQ